MKASRHFFMALVLFSLVPLLFLGSCRKRVEKEKVHTVDFSQKHSQLPSRVVAPKGGTDLYLAFTGEELGYLEPCGCSEGILGGIMRRASALDYFGKKGAQVFPFSLGDGTKKPNRHGKIKYRFLRRALEMMNFKGYALGEKELAAWPDFYQLYQRASFPLLCANLYRDGKPVVKSHTELTWKGKDRTYHLAVMAFLAPKLGQPEGARHQMKLKSAPEVLPPLLEKLRKKNDFLLLLYHGEEEDGQRLLKKYPALDFVLSGHRQKRPEWGKGEKKNWGSIAQKAIMVSFLGLAASKKSFEINDREIFPLDDYVPDKPDLVALYREYIMAVQRAGLPPDRPRRKPTGGTYVGSQRCFSCHKYAAKIWKKTAHSHAWETLEKKGQHKNPDCLKCHTVGYGFVTGYVSKEMTPDLKGVGCESCHGPGSHHVQNPEPGYGKADRGTCLHCHTEQNSPHFDFLKYNPKIEHRQKK